jgi:RNA polymerase sigma factor (sigma-70 family)
MRLARDRSSSSPGTQLVRVVPPPGVTEQADLDTLFIEAYHRLHGRLLDRAERFLDPDAARDAEADAVADIYYRWPYLTPEQRTDEYFFRALHNSVIDTIRRSRGIVALDDAEEELDRQAEHAFDAPTRADTVADVLDLALASMSRRKREVLLLIREERYTYVQAAEALGLKEGTINRHYRLAMDHLRAAFTRAGFRLTEFQPARLQSPSHGATND